MAALPRIGIPLCGTFAGLPDTSRRALFISVAAGLAAGASSAGLLTFVNNILSAGIRAEPASAAAFFGLCILMLAAGILSEVLVLRLTQNILYDVRMWLSRRILSVPLQQLQALGPHRLMATLTDDIGNIAHAYHVLPVLFIEGSIALGGMIYIAWLSRILFVILLIFLVLGLTLFFAAQRSSLRFLQRAREADDALFGHFRALTEGGKELKMNARRRGAFLNDELSVTADKIRRSFNTGLTIYVFGAHGSKLLFFLAIGTVLFVPALAQGTAEDAARGWVLSILFIMGPIETIVNTFPALGQGSVALRKIEALALMMTEEKLIEKDCAIPVVLQQPGVLELAGVSHRYPTDKGEPEFMLGPLDLRIDPGELIFVTGGNGSGKTTFAFLLLGLFKPEKGEIILDGKPIRGAGRDAYRQNFAAVFADAFVFDSLLGYDGGAAAEQASRLLAELHLDHKLSIKDGRFSTIDLSRGQRKRLALLAAFIEDRPFYLFDEWAAEQDPAFREIFYMQFLPQLKARGKTVVVITHDDRYFHLAGRVLHLDAGRIEETGAQKSRGKLLKAQTG
ncbi:MAG: cyclic peptide export ABC transporter [Beijerinckiaceae bacterium]|nr:cyclic peptide export ABC transporter [Beijerinckiaceae bacterium]